MKEETIEEFAVRIKEGLIDVKKEIQISQRTGLTDCVDMCRDIMERLSDKHDMTMNGSLFYYLPLAVQDEINKSHTDPDYEEVDFQ